MLLISYARTPRQIPYILEILASSQFQLVFSRFKHSKIPIWDKKSLTTSNKSVLDTSIFSNVLVRSAALRLFLFLVFGVSGVFEFFYCDVHQIYGTSKVLLRCS